MEKVEFTRDSIKFLISLYEQHPVLYNSSNKLYKNKNIRNQSFKTILEEYSKLYPETTLEDLKKKISILKTQFYAELAKYKKSLVTGAGTDSIFKPTWWCYEYFLFLTDNNPIRPTHSSLNIDQESQDHQYSEPSGDILEFHIYIVNSDDMLGMDVQPQLVWDYKVHRMSFSVKQTYTTEDTRQLSIKQRRCVFEDEIKLKVDSIYTYTACTIECRIKMINSFCNCVPFFYPKLLGTKYCTIQEQKCVASHLTDIKDITKCDCQLGCKNTVYEVENTKSSESKRMEIGFVSWPMVRYKREVLFGWVDLLVSFGGIAGLFLGFSLLSGVEIIYFFTIRTCIAAFRERTYLDRTLKKRKEKPLPDYDLGLVPYFLSKPLPGHGINLLIKQLDGDKKKIKNKIYPNHKIIAVGLQPPFGIEFVN